MNQYFKANLLFALGCISNIVVYPDLHVYFFRLNKYMSVHMHKLDQFTWKNKKGVCIFC